MCFIGNVYFESPKSYYNIFIAMKIWIDLIHNLTRGSQEPVIAHLAQKCLVIQATACKVCLVVSMLYSDVGPYANFVQKFKYYKIILRFFKHTSKILDGSTHWDVKV